MADGPITTSILEDFRYLPDKNPLPSSGMMLQLDSLTSPGRISSSQWNPNAGDASVYWRGAQFADFQSFITFGSNLGVSDTLMTMGRLQGVGGAGTWDGYGARVSISTGQVDIVSVTNAIATVLVSTASSLGTAGDMLLLAGIGGTLSLWGKDFSGTWQNYLTTTNITYTSGYIGFLGFSGGSGGNVRNFGGGSPYPIQTPGPIGGRGASW